MDLLQTLLDAPGVYIIVTPEPGRIVHHWRYGAPGAEIGERDTADVRLVGA
jgi:hypothetical protein